MQKLYVATLIFSVSSLNLLVNVLLHITLQNAGSCGFVEACSFENVCRVDPIVMSPSHNMFLEVLAELVLVYGDLRRVSNHSPRQH